MVLMIATTVVVAIVAVTAAFLFKPVIFPMLLEASAWPRDNEIGTIPVLTIDELTQFYQNKRVLIVGGTRGVGFGIAQAVVNAGAKVTLVGRNQATAQRALQALGCDMNNNNKTNKATFIQGDIGTVANAKETVDKIVKFVSTVDNSDEGDERFDYLVVTAAVFPDWSGRRPHQQDDGIDTPFAVAVVGRYMIYKNMPRFLKPTARVLNVLASGQAMSKIEIDKDLASGRRDPKSLFHSIMNYACGNELVMQLIDADPELNKYTRVSTHPGYVHTELHEGQGLFFDVMSSISFQVAGITVEECGLRQASILASPKLHDKALSFVSSDQQGRVPSEAFQSSVNEYLPWLREFLHTLLLQA